MTMTEIETTLKTNKPQGWSRFARGEDPPAVTPRPGDLMLNCYPRSGLTWLAFLLAQLLKSDPRERLDLNSFEKYVPPASELASQPPTGPSQIVRCHSQYAPGWNKVVYLLRDPRDTLVSYWHFEKLVSRDFNLPLADFLRSNDHWPCEWDRHVAGWTQPGRQPNLVIVRYEELHTDPFAALQRVQKLAGTKWSPAQVEAAIEASRFEHMRAAEERISSVRATVEPPEHFVRRGRVGSWQEEMGYTELRIIEEKYGKVMRQVGYEPRS
jgi:hypothetical protein